MLSGLALWLDQDPADPRLIFCWQPAPRPAGWLHLQTRTASHVLSAPVTLSDGKALASVPVADLVGAGVLRWDARTGDAQACAATAMTWAVPPDAERHFFCTTVDQHGLSAYLSDSAGSLVICTATLDQHARIVSAENARAAFPRWLEELPLQQDLVLFESFLGKAYAGNPRYIYEALRQARPDLRCVWSYSGNAQIPGDPPRVQRGSAEYFKLLAQAKYRVNNVIFAGHGRKPETVYLQTWHGTPLKRLGNDIGVGGPEADARENFYRESRGWTFLLSENPYSTEIFHRAFRYDGSVLEAGYPLTDPLVAPRPELREAIITRLGLPAGHRFVLYAPTWRDHRPVGRWRFDFDLQLDLAAISAALEPDQILLIKAHHLVGAGLDHQILPPNVRNVSQVDDATELCVIADVLITDYSSVFFDYATTGRPILFYCYDLDQYAERIRGLYLDLEHDLPGPVARTTAELVSLLNKLPTMQAQYADRYSAFRERFCHLNDGAASQRVVQAVFGPEPLDCSEPGPCQYLN